MLTPSSLSTLGWGRNSLPQRLVYYTCHLQMSNVHHQARFFQKVFTRAHRADLERDLRLLPLPFVDLAVVARTNLAVEFEFFVRYGEVVLYH
jgi:hypothetical protein